MPWYEYICKACGHTFEEIQKFSDPPISKCPQCGKKKIEKKISLTSFQLKGSGWYKDGYTAAAAKAKENAASSAPAENKSEKKTADVKPETKTEPKTEKKETKTEIVNG